MNKDHEVENLSELIIKVIKAKGKILICGNGGSSCESSHFAAELVGRFKHERRALPAISLNDPAIITAIANDYSFDKVFSRQIEALGKSGDLLITLSTSGTSKNIIEATTIAEEMGMYVWPFHTNNDLKTDTAKTQQFHLWFIHKVSEKVEEAFL